VTGSTAKESRSTTKSVPVAGVGLRIGAAAAVGFARSNLAVTCRTTTTKESGDAGTGKLKDESHKKYTRLCFIMQNLTFTS